jgi:hypothetical protein
MRSRESSAIRCIRIVSRPSGRSEQFCLPPLLFHRHRAPPGGGGLWRLFCSHLFLFLFTSPKAMEIADHLRQSHEGLLKRASMVLKNKVEVGASGGPLCHRPRLARLARGLTWESLCQAARHPGAAAACGVWHLCDWAQDEIGEQRWCLHLCHRPRKPGRQAPSHQGARARTKHVQRSRLTGPLVCASGWPSDSQHQCPLCGGLPHV